MRRRLCALALLAGVPALARHFDLTAIPRDTLYTAERGYGYEAASTQPPYFFSVRVPEEGNYRVTLTFGDAQVPTVTTVKAELRRLMIEKVSTVPGKPETRTILVNVRRPQFPGGEVRRKPRESTSEAWAWDDRLTLEFTGAHPGVTALDIDKVDVPTIFLAGDSTSTDQPVEPYNSWGQMLTRWFQPLVAIANHGESGESLRSFLRERRFDKLKSVMRPGDWLFIQMGHNDQKETGEGVGAFTTYKADLKQMVAEARQRGVTPVLITPMHRIGWGPDGKIANSLGDYPAAVRQLAEEEKIALIDLHAMSQVLYEAIGPENLPKAFAENDKTHHNNYGSYELAQCVVLGIRRAKLPLAQFLSADAPHFDPAHPDPLSTFDIPAEPRGPLVKPVVYVIGDSTANNKDHRGWADPFADYFDARQVRCVNRARAGRSSRTFFTEGLWEDLRAQLRPGDTVLIQFGHNDGGPPDRDRARGSLPGLGEESQEFTLPDGRREVVHTFGWYMRKFISETKSAGGTPVVLSPTVRNIWKDGRVERGPGQFAKWAAEIARAEGVQFLDVTNTIADRYEQLGADRVKPLFPEDHTHTSPAGADLTAALIAGMMPALPHNPRYPLAPDPKLPALFLIGDSTVRNANGDGANGQWGWGEPLSNHFDSAKISVVNRAVGGLSSRTYWTGGWWQHVLDVLKPGDFVMMQFGHNDNGPLDDTARARGTLPGTGDETREIDNPITRQHEVVHTYGWYLRQFIAAAREHGSTPILCTLVPRKIWTEGRIARDDAKYAGWAREVAAAQNVPLVDLNAMIAQRYDELGPEKVDSLFADPHTHTSRAGAELNAEFVLRGLRALKNDPLAVYEKR